jgi:hypothetical protein
MYVFYGPGSTPQFAHMSSNKGPFNLNFQVPYMGTSCSHDQTAKQTKIVPVGKTGV